MSRPVTVVMYHFVRDFARTRYPGIKGLDVRDFEQQLRYILQHYNVIGMQELVAAAHDTAAGLPDRPLLLTFDDGYIDHYSCVFPLLDRYGVSGAFFPPACAVRERRLLDVNKIHFMLAAAGDARRLVDAVRQRIVTEGREFGLQEEFEFYYRQYAGESRYDSPDVMFVKRALQRELPGEFRTRLVDILFREFVTDNETAFASEVYMTTEQAACMRRNGMYMGNHGDRHCWLNAVDPGTQAAEIQAGLEFITALGTDPAQWVMCYPYGGYDESLVGLLKSHGCGLALTVETAIADLDRDNPYAIPRLDTNDLPADADAAPGHWTQLADNTG